MQWIPFTTALLSLAFAAYTLRLFIVKKENCLLMWSAALLFYGLACGMEFIIASGGINLLVYRLWYVTGAIFSAAYLAVGALYCMAPRKIAFPLLLLLAIASIYACIIVFITPIDISGMHDLSSRPLPLQIRILSPFFNIAAGLVMLIAIIYGINILIKKKGATSRGVSLILIGAGMILPGIGGMYFRLGMQASIYIYVMDLMGLILFYVGVLLGHVINAIAEPEAVPQKEQA
jgi:glucan phosphoethanolaminetransferase (alkaline phosphatase superfamily)